MIIIIVVVIVDVLVDFDRKVLVVDVIDRVVCVVEGMGFRRFMLRSSVKVEVEWMLLSLAYNLLKLHHKTRKQRLGTGLMVPAAFPAGL